jgi:hypothetical protein
MSGAPAVVESRRKNLRERREHLWTGKVRRLPCFDQIIKKLVAGQAVAAVARWCHELNPEGELHDKTFETWRKYLTALAIHVRRDSERVKRVKVEPLAYQAVMKDLEQQQKAIVDDPVPRSARSTWSAVKKAQRDLEAETILKSCFVIQLERVERLLEMERKLNLLLPGGYKEVRVLTKIAVAIAEYEIGQLRMRGGSP